MDRVPTIPRIAAAAFTQRQQRARRAVGAGELTRAMAEDRLRPWLAIACRAGADLPELEDPLADLRQKDPAGNWLCSDAEARAVLADQICPRASWAPLLAKARDHALRDAEALALSPRTPPPERDAALAHARALRALADHFTWDPAGSRHVPPYLELPPPEGKPA